MRRFCTNVSLHSPPRLLPSEEEKVSSSPKDVPKLSRSLTHSCCYVAAAQHRRGRRTGAARVHHTKTRSSGLPFITSLWKETSGASLDHFNAHPNV